MATTQQGLSDNEARTWWQTLYSDFRNDRDNDGPLGQEQLWVPNISVSRDRLRENYEDNANVAGSNRFLTPDQGILAMLDRTVANQNVSFSAQHLNRTDETQRADLRQKRAADDEKPEDKGEQVGAKGEPPPKKIKPFNVTDACTKTYGTLKKKVLIRKVKPKPLLRLKRKLTTGVGLVCRSTYAQVSACQLR